MVWFILALAGLVAMQAIYWLVTHPVNKVWTAGQSLSVSSAGFFAIGRHRTEGKNWVGLRNQWEYSHVIRAGCNTVSLVTLLISGC